MKAVEFIGIVKNQKISLPNEQVVLPDGKKVRVIVFIEENSESSDFKEMTQEQFLKGYDKEDSAYDSY